MDHSYSRCENKSYLPLLFCFIDNTLNGFYRFTGSIEQYQFNDDTFTKYIHVHHVPLLATISSTRILKPLTSQYIEFCILLDRFNL